MPQGVYLETTIISYLTSRPSRDPWVEACQKLTKEWWAERRGDFTLYVSEFVIVEASQGDQAASARRLDLLGSIPELGVTIETRKLAGRLLIEVPLPPKAELDASHIAISAVHGLDYLLTWNCTHIANASLRSRIEDVCRDCGVEPPVICTPQELMEEPHGPS